MTFLVDDGGVLAGVCHPQGGGAVPGDSSAAHEGQRLRPLVVVVEVGPVSSVLPTQGSGEGENKAELPVMVQGHLHRAVFRGDGVDDIRGDPVSVHAHAQVQVGQAGALRHILAVDDPGHAATHVQLHGHILSGHFLQHRSGYLRLAVHVDGNGVPVFRAADFLLNVGPSVVVVGTGTGGLGRLAGAAASPTPAAGSDGPTGVDGRVIGKDGVRGDQGATALLRVPALEVVVAPGGGGQAGQLAVHRGLGGGGGYLRRR